MYLQCRLPQSNKVVWLDLTVNGVVVCSLYGFIQYDFADAGNAVILSVNQTDKIEVNGHTGFENYLFGSSDHIFTTFSGAQIISKEDLAIPGKVCLERLS